MPDYLPIPAYRLRQPIGLFQSACNTTQQVKAQSPAVLVMTDLRQTPAVTTTAGVRIDQALDSMKSGGIRLLFVMDRYAQMIGLITATDIQGEKPVRLYQERGLRREEISVGDIMTPFDELEVLPMDRVLHATVGDIIATLQHAGRRHALVTDRHPRTESDAVRGLFSATQISRQIGRPIEAMYIARTFSEVGQVLNS